MKSSLVVPFAILIAGAILAVAVYLTVRIETTPSSWQNNQITVRPVDTSDHILGNPQASVQIIEYADFDCDACSAFSTTMHQIMNDYGTSGKVSWVFRNFPLIELHPNAQKHAEAAECVAQVAGNTAYWTFIDSLFAYQPIDPLRYPELAKAAGADPSAVATCMQNASDGGLDTRINASRQEALKTGAHSTPYSLIIVPGQPITVLGAWNYADLKDLIASALSTLK